MSMIIFQCYGGPHSSVVAASIYTGKLPRRRLPARRELLALHYFDRVRNCEVGMLCPIGLDDHGNRVYALGSRGWRPEIGALIAGCLPLLEVAPEEVALVNCYASIDLLTRVGGFISRRLEVPLIGRPLVCLGIRRSYFQLLRLVEEFEQNPSRYTLKQQFK